MHLINGAGQTGIFRTEIFRRRLTSLLAPSYGEAGKQHGWFRTAAPAKHCGRRGHSFQPAHSNQLRLRRASPVPSVLQCIQSKASLNVNCPSGLAAARVRNLHAPAADYWTAAYWAADVRRAILQRSQRVPSASTSCLMSVGECTGPGVIRRRSVPFGTVG